MGKSLVIVESKAKAGTINKILGRGYKVMASIGHVRDLPKKKLGIDTDDGFKPTYITIRGKGKVLKDLKAAAKNADMVYLASDFDREGEAIAWHITELLKLPEDKVRRVVFNEITKHAILDAMENPGAIDMNKVDAQQARRVLDRLVGYEVSPVLWKTIYYGLSAHSGRREGQGHCRRAQGQGLHRGKPQAAHAEGQPAPAVHHEHAAA